MSSVKKPKETAAVVANDTTAVEHARNTVPAEGTRAPAPQLPVNRLDGCTSSEKETVSACSGDASSGKEALSASSGGTRSGSVAVSTSGSDKRSSRRDAVPISRGGPTAGTVKIGMDSAQHQNNNGNFQRNGSVLRRVRSPRPDTFVYERVKRFDRHSSFDPPPAAVLREAQVTSLDERDAETTGCLSCPQKYNPNEGSEDNLVEICAQLANVHQDLVIIGEKLILDGGIIPSCIPESGMQLAVLAKAMANKAHNGKFGPVSKDMEITRQESIAVENRKDEVMRSDDKPEVVEDTGCWANFKSCCMCIICWMF